MVDSLLGPDSKRLLHASSRIVHSDPRLQHTDATENPRISQKIDKATNFLDLPREIRDEIYGILLIKKLDNATYAKYKAHLTGEIGTAARKCQRVLDNARVQTAIVISDPRTLGDVKKRRKHDHRMTMASAQSPSTTAIALPLNIQIGFRPTSGQQADS